MRINRATSVRAVGAMQVAAGATTIVRARNVAATPCKEIKASTMAQIIRILGARQVVQGLIMLATPSSTVANGAALVDAVHGTSMLPIALMHGPYRRPAAISATLAATGAAAALAVNRR